MLFLSNNNRNTMLVWVFTFSASIYVHNGDGGDDGGV